MRRISTSLLLACAAALCLGSTLARAEDEKPAVSIKTKYVEIEVTIEKALRAYPEFYSKLLADGKKYAADNQKEALDAWMADPASFRGMAWTFDRGYRLRAAAGPYVSVLIDDGEFTGGAHPVSHLSTRLWNREANRDADMETLFREIGENGPTATALAKLVRDAIIEEKKKRDVPIDEETDRWLEPIKADFSSLGAPSLAPSTAAGHSSGLTFHFSPYAIGPYAEGSYTIFVPFAPFASYLTDDAKKIFAGDRPKSYEDE
ncbi:MAG TPA: DUF3298 domain-containing protein [Xanthobacteraceae bacterium]|nr:DUF3298 domain-containing protein [Xanthobacteraceae bacterium]